MKKGLWPYNKPHSSGIFATDPYFHQFPWDEHIAFFVLFIKAGKRSHRKTKNDIH
jgi:hypothetical protein